MSCCSSGKSLEIKSCCDGGKSSGPGVGVDEDYLSRTVWRIGIGLILSSLSMTFGIGINMTPPETFSGAYWTVHIGLLSASLVVLLLLGGTLFSNAYKALRAGRLSLEGLFLMSIVGALVGSGISTFTGGDKVYYEVVSIVLVIYTIGQVIMARSRSKAIEEVRKVRETYEQAHVLDEAGKRELVSVDTLDCCSKVSVGPGEVVTVDGIILSGEGLVTQTAITGELEPVSVGVGGSVYAGSFSVDGHYVIRATGLRGQRKIDGILDRVEAAQLTPSGMQSAADKVMQYFLPFVAVVCAGTFFYWNEQGSWLDGLFNAMSVLLVACPCALGLAVPIAVWSGLWRFSTLGFVANSGEVLDGFARVNRVIFDKTGTLSEAELVVSGLVHAKDWSRERLLEWVQVVERGVEHPVARALRTMEVETSGKCELVKSRIVPGKGIEAEILCVGERSLVEIGDVSWVGEGELDKPLGKKHIGVRVDGKVVGIFGMDEVLREGSVEALDTLRGQGIEVEIFTGDIAYELEGVKVTTGMLPEEKAERVGEYVRGGECVVFVGDGVNDAAAMAEASVGVAMEEGSDLAQSAAMAVYNGRSFESLPEAVSVAQKIQRTIRSNMIFAASYNVLGISLAACGLLNPIIASVLMLLSSLMVCFRSVRVNVS